MGDSGEKVCRDYLRNVCNRGKKCRFVHPQAGNTCLNPQEEKVNFCKHICHDFQNTGCCREGCKFIHLSSEDEEKFVNSGVLPNFVLEDSIAKAVIPCLPGETPVCRDYLSGECRRGKSCRFRHLSHCTYRKELDVLFGVQPPPIESTQATSPPESKRLKTSHPPHTAEETCQSPSTHNFSQNHNPYDTCTAHVHSSERYSPSPHMHSSEHYSPSPHMFTPERYSASPHHTYGACQMTQMAPPIYPAEGCCGRSQEALVPHNPHSLQEENSYLRKQNFELRRQVSDLATTNEFLLEQNAALRILRKNGGMVTLQPSASATLNVGPAPQQLVASAVPVSIAPVTGPGPGQMTLSTMAVTGQGSTQQFVPVSCHASGQQIMAAVSTVTVAGQTGSPALLATAVPVSVSSSVANCGQLVPVSAVPVSLATVSMAPVHIPPIVTAASEPPHSIAMSVSGATSLMSYPIMTQPLLQTR